MKRTILSTMLIMLIAVPLSQAQDNIEQHPNFTGNWNLNEKLSDDIQQIMMKAMGGGGGKGRGGGGGGGGRGGGGGMGGGGGRGGGGGMGGQPGGGQSGPNPQAQKRAEEMKQQYSRLEIFQDGLELNVTDGLDITRLLHTDGRTENIWTQRGEATATANWEKDELVIQWKTRQDSKSRTRKYQLSEDGTRLNVRELIRIPGSKEMISAQLVYDLHR
jgi:hypothetical protein